MLFHCGIWKEAILAGIGPHASVIMISQTTLTVLICVASFILSVSTALWLGGMRWGEMRSDLRTMADRLAKIEGMFTMRLKDDNKDGTK